MLPQFVVWRYVLLFGVVLKRRDGDSLLRTSYKKLCSNVFILKSLSQVTDNVSQ